MEQIIIQINLEHLLESSSDEFSSDDEFEITRCHERQRCRRRPRIQNYIEVIWLYSDYEFKSHYRMRRSTFYSLLELIKPKLVRKSERFGRYPISPEKQLLVAIWSMATPDSYRSVCDRFDIGKATAFRAIRRVCRAIYSLTSRFITWPTTDKAMATIAKVNAKYGFPQVIGALDGTHIPIAAPKEFAEAYVNRKGYHSIQLQVVCDADLKFIHCYTGQVGSVHDTRVFRPSDLQNRLIAENFHENSHLLADGGYTIQNHIMVPYRDNGHLTEAEKNFNMRLSSARMMVERSLGLLKGRFRSLLDQLPMRRTDLIPEYIIVCCVLHNLCLMRNDHIDIPVIVNPPRLNIQPDDRNMNMIRQQGIEKRIKITHTLMNRRV